MAISEGTGTKRKPKVPRPVEPDVPSLQMKAAAAKKRVIKFKATTPVNKLAGQGYVSAPGQNVQVEVMKALFPAINPDVIDVAAGAGTKFQLGTPTPNPRYDPITNILQMTPLGGVGSFAHELTHFGQAKAPWIFNTGNLTLGQVGITNRANAVMGFAGGTGGLIPALLAGGPPVAQNEAEYVAHSIGGTMPQNPIPASYFQNIFSGGLRSAQLQQNRDYTRRWGIGR